MIAEQTKINPAIAGLIVRYQTEAHKRGLVWDLTYNECRLLFASPCFYCDAPPMRVYKMTGGSLYYSGLDRIDSKRGYTTPNVVACCWDCNRAKGSLSLPAFEEWVERISTCLRERHWAGIGREMEFCDE